jgi:hypothetical protein
MEHKEEKRIGNREDTGKKERSFILPRKGC